MNHIYGLTLLLIALLVVRVWLTRKFILGAIKDPTGNAGFTLSDLRQLHRQGAMTDDEFERAQAEPEAKLIHGLAAGLANPGNDRRNL